MIPSMSNTRSESYLTVTMFDLSIKTTVNSVLDILSTPGPPSNRIYYFYEARIKFGPR